MKPDKSQIRRRILKKVIENIQCLASREYQERVWVKAEGPECDDIDDAICDFFDDSEYIFHNYQKYDIDRLQYTKLIELNEKLRKFTDLYPVFWEYKSTSEIINTPEWEEIRILSKNILERKLQN